MKKVLALILAAAMLPARSTLGGVTRFNETGSDV